jgi:tetratricopeptide (TPR) repeat protein
LRRKAKILFAGAKEANNLFYAEELHDDSLDSHFKRAAVRVRMLRARLESHPNWSLGWSELARHFLALGEDEKATRAMETALHNASNNRYLCRAATRLFVHLDDPARALSLLKCQPSLREDPWLLAAEIATSSVMERKSRYIDAARRLLKTFQGSPHQISELAAAVGTVELVHGGQKEAKALFVASLAAPTENSLAQAQWAVDRDLKIAIPAAAWTADSNEARALAFRSARKWDDALAACSLWLAEEPFSHRPAYMGSCLGFRPEHAKQSEAFASAGLRSDPQNALLRNNRAFARARQGKVLAAYDDLKFALQSADARSDAHLLATLGLVAFRGGQIDLGRQLYGESIAWFSSAKNQSCVASAAMNWAYEELHVDPGFADTAVDLGKRVAKLPAARDPDVLGMAEFLSEEGKKQKSLFSRLLRSEDLFSEQISEDEIRAQADLMSLPDRAKSMSLRLLTDPKLPVG